jgi:DNA-binding MarR family transcriptional regulator
MYDTGKSPESDVLALINEIPTAFFRLSAIAEILFADLGVTGPARGVLRDLFVDGERTAPELARRKSVSRQATQVVLDDLVAKGYVATTHNPRHKRSKLYVLTPEGIALCVRIQELELNEIRRILPGVGPMDFAAAAETLRTLSEVLQRQLDGAVAADAD